MEVPEVSIKISEILSNLATFLGIVIAAVVYFRDRKNRKRDQEIATYSDLNDKYIDYLKLCLQYSDIGLYSPTHSGGHLTAEEKRSIFYEIIVCILERTFFLYHDKSTQFKKRQWEGWESYIESWLRREEFRKEWAEYKNQFDQDFCKYIDGLIENLKLLHPEGWEAKTS
ncbi:MAG: hypothetical protein L0Y68_04100 [Candidatus Dadabacteria bacterium]|nr:hypothetical protein [Candidatus Dadabacteria bacterium]